MGFLDTILGRTKPAQPNLDELFSLPTAAITLEAGMNLVPTGTGSVCFRAAEGKAFSDIEKDVRELLSMGSGTASVEVSTDSYGFTWLTCQHAATGSSSDNGSGSAPSSSAASSSEVAPIFRKI